MDEKMEKGIINIAKAMVTTVTNLSLYSIEHSQVKRQLEKTYESLLDTLKDHKKISFVVIEGDLIVENFPVSNDIFLAKFAEKLQRKAIGGITFSEGLSKEELMNLIKSLALQTDTKSEIFSSPHVKIGRVEVRIKGKKQKADSGIGAQGVREFMEVYQGAEKNKKLDALGMQSIISNIMNDLRQESNPLKALAPMKSFSDYTFTHSVNVCILTMLQAMSLGFEGQILHDIGIAALLHDIGKLFVPEEILSKDNKLTEKEWVIIREHPVKGALYLMDTAGIPGLSVVVAYEHHMLYDFSGYPKVEKGWKQNLCSQMTSLADMFDAMQSYKNHKTAIAEHEVLASIVQKSGTNFNPILVKNFIKIMSKEK